MKNIVSVIRRSLLIIAFGKSFNCFSQSVIDPLGFGVVLDDPRMKSVVVKNDVTYLQDAKDTLHIDIYSPPGLKAAEKRPAIIFLNAIGENEGRPRVKSWGIYSTWPRLMAAEGYIGISMETDGNRIQESIQKLFTFLTEQGRTYKIDTARLGIYAASANVSQSSEYIMGKNAFAGIKAAVLYYGRPPVGPFRKDLPVLFVISEGDVNPGYASLWGEVLKNNAPWTIKMCTGMPHAFDAYLDNDEARKIVKETISFWKNNLDPVQPPSWKYSKARDVFGSIQMDQPRAMGLLKSLVDENPHDVGAILFYANELRREKKTNEAAVMFDKVLTEDPENLEALTSMAVLLYTQDKNQDAESYMAKAVRTGKIRRNDYARMGFFLLAADKNKEAALYYEKAIAAGADGFDYYNLACAYAKMNDVENAIRALGDSIKGGYVSRSQVDNDHDFDTIRTNEKFKQLLASMK